ncbi:acyltransferase [Pseudoalteromonas luteoviolacea]|uniref:acyltransferase n=1 Tax=Pseudoalteromonas luteoviolacea TaxID=43657 RepID=UPI001F19CA55|nr:acyltransferase [Pseudoalteromonas luteoviolacea]MCF6439046.1 acyltransferase [Pseudoalteromonas luteoviolacea]
MYRLFYSNNKPILNNVKVFQPTQFVGKGAIQLNSVSLGCWPSPYLLTGCGYIEARNIGASIEIDAGSQLNNNFVIIADKSSVRIGKRCQVGPNFFVTDSDFHGLDKAHRNTNDYGYGDVEIGDDVFIGSNVQVLKNVTIGSGSVIASGSIVTQDVMENALYAGIPAKFIKSLNGANFPAKEE